MKNKLLILCLIASISFAATASNDYTEIKRSLNDRVYSEWSFYGQQEDTVAQYYNTLIKSDTQNEFVITIVQNKISIRNKKNNHFMIINFYYIGEY